MVSPTTKVLFAVADIEVGTLTAPLELEYVTAIFVNLICPFVVLFDELPIVKIAL